VVGSYPHSEGVALHKAQWMTRTKIVQWSSNEFMECTTNYQNSLEISFITPAPPSVRKAAKGFLCSQIWLYILIVHHLFWLHPKMPKRILECPTWIMNDEKSFGGIISPQLRKMTEDCWDCYQGCKAYF
jgi:hypothetical protein